MHTIFDTPDTVTDKLSALREAGITAIMRYDDPSGNPHSWKQISEGEYNAILKAGIAVAIVSEWGNDHAGYFSGNSGTRDAHYSVRRAHDRVQPQSSAIYFAVDFDASKEQLADNVVPYFQRANEIIRGAGFRIGCYGSGLTNATLKANGLIDLQMITCSSGFAGSRAAVNAGDYDLWQVFGLCDQHYMGLSVDWDMANPAGSGDWGQIMPGGVPQPPAHDVRWLQGELNKLGAAPPLAVDGIVGPASMKAIIDYVTKTSGDT